MAPQEMEKRIGELIYKEKDNGIRGKTKRFIQAWKQIGKENFINTRFYLKFKDYENQQRLEENIVIIPFQRNIRREESLPRNVERRIGRRNNNAYLTGSSEMVKPYIPDKETQWNMEKDSGCEQVKQRNREITLQDAWSGKSTIPCEFNGQRNVSQPQIGISPHLSISKLNTIHSIQLQQQQLRIQNNAVWDQTQPNLLRRSNRINLQTNKNKFRNQKSKLLRRYTSNPSEQTNSQNINNGNNENIGIVRMDNISREMRNRTEIDNNIRGMDIKPEGDEQKIVR
ncbi:MAG: hypothetical protein EZS28_001554 [Streblomastix strix]|uniref:Uncharacterized protein n=1 Tax=Streblomastix strix TaxID=222440 RepID=A0A5J4X7A8_9EUKA|nr:MAG: hypothetical protein EZS28_001554 [Streblomastix strix]